MQFLMKTMQTAVISRSISAFIFTFPLYLLHLFFKIHLYLKMRDYWSQVLSLLQYSAFNQSNDWVALKSWALFQSPIYMFTAVFLWKCFRNADGGRTQASHCLCCSSAFTSFTSNFHSSLFTLFFFVLSFFLLF